MRGYNIRQKRNSPEHDLQVAVTNAVKYILPNVLFCASAGGMKTHAAIAAKMKASGYSAGFPDLFFYEPRNGFNGLAIELKAGTNTPQKNQLEWKQKLIDRGYRAEVCTGIDETFAVLSDYFGVKF